MLEQQHAGIALTSLGFILSPTLSFIAHAQFSVERLHGELVMGKRGVWMYILAHNGKDRLRCLGNTSQIDKVHF